MSEWINNAQTTDGVRQGYLPSGEARLWVEASGSGKPMVFLHAGVADSRQWNREFEAFRKHYRVVRFDFRGYGRSEPVEETFTHMADLHTVLNAVGIDEPVIMVGCSMGGTLALDFALEHPEQVAALVLSGSGPGGLKLDVPRPALFDAIKVAEERGDLEAVAELETQLWFDGDGRNRNQVDPLMRSLAYSMNRQVLEHDAKGLGKREPDSGIKVADRMAPLIAPLLIIVGKYDIPFIHAAADFMQGVYPGVTRVNIENAAHLANMDQPDRFSSAITNFLRSVNL